MAESDCAQPAAKRFRMELYEGYNLHLETLRTFLRHADSYNLYHLLMIKTLFYRIRNNGELPPGLEIDLITEGMPSIRKHSSPQEIKAANKFAAAAIRLLMDPGYGGAIDLVMNIDEPDLPRPSQAYFVMFHCNDYAYRAIFARPSPDPIAIKAKYEEWLVFWELGITE